MCAPGGGGIFAGGTLGSSYVAPGGGGMEDADGGVPECAGEGSSIPPGALATPNIGSSVVEVGQGGRPLRVPELALGGVVRSPACTLVFSVIGLLIVP